MARDHDHPARLEPLVELGAGDGETGHPQPEEERALRPVDADVAAVESGAQDLDGMRRPLRVVRADDFAAEREHLAALDETGRERGPEASRCEAEDGVGGAERRDDRLVRDHDPGAHARSPSFERLHAQNRVLVQASVASP